MSEPTSAPNPTAGPDGPTLLQGLLDVLDLEATGTDAHGQDLFVGASQPQPHGRVFGGQVLGQTIVAATRTVPDGRPVHSMHGYFLRPGDSTEPITFAVERLRVGDVGLQHLDAAPGQVEGAEERRRDPERVHR